MADCTAQTDLFSRPIDMQKGRHSRPFNEKPPKGRRRENSMVGEKGFEPSTLWSQTRCATRLRYSPTGV